MNDDYKCYQNEYLKYKNKYSILKGGNAYFSMNNI